MAHCAIVGTNWGDEGKGRMVDLLTEHYDVVVRYLGGGNAGHTVINEYGKFTPHLLPWHRDLDALEEQRLADGYFSCAQMGRTPQGCAG